MRYVFGTLVGMTLGLCIALGIRHYVTSGKTPPRAPLRFMPPAGQALVHEILPPPMGNVPFEIRVWGRALTAFIDDSEGAEALVESIEAQVSSWRPESDTSRLNAAPPGEDVPLGEHAFNVCRHAFTLAELTGGVFDAAIGPLVALWREAARRGAEPTADELARAGKVCTWRAFRLDLEARTCRKLIEGARLDFGGVAKGYIVDHVVEFLIARGVPSGIVTAGGDLRVFGADTSRKVGIAHPLQKDALYGYYDLAEGAAATSGNTARAYTIGEKTAGHIMDPRVLAPVAGPLSVTVMAPDCTTADGLATAVYVLGEVEGMALVERLPTVEALILVEEDGAMRQVRSSGFPEVHDVSALQEEALDG